MKAVIRAVGSYAPARRMDNVELSTLVDTNDEWIFTHTGIKNRHIAAPEQATSDLGIAAARNAIANCGGDFSPDQIDLVICATASPDFPGFPSCACLIQNGIGAKNAGAWDLVAACTGFIGALDAARSAILSQSAKNVLVVGAEVFSRLLNWKDRSTCVLFGDGAGACIVSAVADNDGEAKALGIPEHRDLHLEPHGFIGKSVLKSDGSGAEYLQIPAGGTRLAVSDPSDPNQYVAMNGRQVYVFAVQAIIDSVQEILARNSIRLEDVDLIIPHQANRRIIEASCKRAGWDESRFYMNMEEYANTSAASIPLAMDCAVRDGRLRRGMRVVTIGFGGGLTWGGNFFVF